MSRKIIGSFNIILIVAGFLICLGATSAWAKTAPIKQEEVNRAIEQHIEKNMPWPPGTMRCEILSRLPDIPLPSGNISWKVDVKGNEEYLGETFFVFKLYANGVLFREDPIRVRIEIQKDFVVSAASLSKDAVISSNDVTTKKRWVRSIPLNAITDVDDAIGKALSVSVRPNMEIGRNMLKEVAAVKRGKIVQVVVETGALNITTTGLAEEDGVEGALVRVRNMSSNKIITARVVGESRVRVVF